MQHDGLSRIWPAGTAQHHGTLPPASNGMYNRKKLRAPRQVEQSAAMHERDQLLEKVEHLATRNHELATTLKVTELMVDKLLFEKILLARELNEARAAIDFLKGEHNGTRSLAVRRSN
jgi:hypothetical protein